MTRLRLLLVAWLCYSLTLGLPFSFCADAPILLAPPQRAQVDIQAAPSMLVSLDYTDANLNTVLKGIAFSYDLNVIISSEITGKVSAQLKDIPIDEALNAILGVNGYGFSRKGNIVYVLPKAQLEQSTELIPLSYLKPTDAVTMLGKALSSVGDVKTNEATNSVIVTDLPQNIKKVHELLKEVDVAPIQVLIEARIVDIKRTEIEKMGTAISATYSAGGNLGDVTFDSGISDRDPDGGQITLTPSFKNLSADITIDALVQNDKARVLASPSIATLSGQEASITIGDKYPYKNSTSVTGSTSTTSTQFIDVGTKLRVTPTVSSDGWITMKVHPEVSSVVKVTDNGPQITTREADATIRVKDRETIVIGGLISKSDTRGNNGVPGLGSIPVLGWFFKRHSTDQRESELTVFITPRIIYSPHQVQADKPRPESTSDKLLPPMPAPIPAAVEAAAPAIVLASVPEVPPVQLVMPPVKPAVAVLPPREAFVDGSVLGSDLDLLSGLLGYAEGLEKDLRKNPKNDMYLSSELVRTYKMILQQFPGSGNADFCLFKICELYTKEFGKCDAAKEAMSMLKDNYPKSSYVRMAESLVASCQEASAFFAGKAETKAAQ